MMRLSLVFAALLPLTACLKDETVRAYGGGNHIWTVKELRDQPFAATATLTFPETGRIAGNAPCNSYSATMDIPYPWFGAGPIAATKRACPDLAAESVFFDALKAATIVEVHGTTMLLSDENNVLLLLRSDG